MKLGIALIAAALCVAGPALAQAPATSNSAKPAQHAIPGQTAAATQSAEASPSLQKPDPEKEAAIRKLMDLMGTSKLGEGMTNQITYQVREAMSQHLQGDQLTKFVGEFSEKIATHGPDKAVNDATAAAYASHFSMADIQAMTEYYGSPIGQKMVKTIPQVMQEAQQAGQPIERDAAIGVLTDMSTEYPELKAMLPGANSKPQAESPSQPPTPATPATPAPAPHQ